jgi:hypothetical protein
MEVVTCVAEGFELLAWTALNYGIVNAPVQANGGSRKDRTALVRVIANRDDVIERRVKKFVQRL